MTCDPAGYPRVTRARAEHGITIKANAQERYTMDYQTIIYEKKERIARVTINRPRVLNAIDMQTIKELIMVFRQIQSDDELRVVVLTGAGDRSFSTGHDIKESMGKSESVRKVHTDVYELMFAIWNSGKAVVARVDGHCLGISLDLALVCDFTIASADSTFGEPEIRFSSGSEFPMLPWVVGMKQAKYLMLTGDTVSADEALRMGMVTKVVPKAELDAEVDTLTRKLSNVAAFAMKMNKSNINKAFEAMGFINGMSVALENVSLLVVTETEERKIFSTIKAEKGLKEAMAWRDLLFK